MVMTISWTAKTFTTAIVLVVALFYHFYYNRDGAKSDGSLISRSMHADYFRLHYGADIEMVARTCVAHINHKYHHIRERNLTSSAIKVVLIGVNDGVSALLWEKRAGDSALNIILFPGTRFSFASLGEAVEAVDKYFKYSTTGQPREPVFVLFLLISSRDPELSGPKLHSRIDVPSTITSGGFAIMGTGFFDVPAHALHSSSTVTVSTIEGTRDVPLENHMPRMDNDGVKFF
jgi:hypothetical protein